MCAGQNHERRNLFNNYIKFDELTADNFIDLQFVVKRGAKSEGVEVDAGTDANDKRIYSTILNERDGVGSRIVQFCAVS